ncbi:apolipoprotein N-acyltransferase [Allosphingosinicella sp.]|jgi:apolipoprotein N-acyltransferase|uniref:apolipoprotein N-acyltransferase n=1 Tax=Allosphingosinicella sp. TaxID=2823234 RepID=UPI002F20A9C1
MKPLLLAFLAGLAAACGFEPWALWPLTLLGFAALLWLIAAAPGLWTALARGWAFGVGHFVLGLNWIATAFTYQSAMPAWLGWVAVVLLSLYLAVYPAMAAGLTWRYGRAHPLALVLWFAAAWIVTEWLRATMFTGFAWNPAGVALLPTPVARLAAWTGTYGLSGVAMLLAGAALLAVRRHWRSAGAVAGTVAAASALTFIAAPAPPATEVAVRIVQPNIGQQDKWRPGFAAEILERLGSLSMSSGDGPRLLLWPEAAVTEPLADDRPGALPQVARTRRQVQRLVGPRDLLLAGGLTVRSTDGLTVSSGTNSVFAIDGSGTILGRYDKAHLVPYGEYLPMRPILSAIGLSRLAPGDMDFDPGPGPQTLDLPLVGRVGFQLCYEIIFSGEVVDRANRPNFLFNPSNDAWFGAWGPPQHLAQARLRALEEGLPVIRSTPTGISAVIDSDGRLLHSIPMGAQAFIDARLPAPKAPTLFARFGNLLPMLLALALAAGAIAVARKAR